MEFLGACFGNPAVETSSRFWPQSAEKRNICKRRRSGSRYPTRKSYCRSQISAVFRIDQGAYRNLNDESQWAKSYGNSWFFCYFLLLLRNSVRSEKSYLSIFLSTRNYERKLIRNNNDQRCSGSLRSLISLKMLFAHCASVIGTWDRRDFLKG